MARDRTLKIKAVTEKTDGMCFLIGRDEEGFYTQSSSSSTERMRTAHDYFERAERRQKETGRSYNPIIQAAFAQTHAVLAEYEPLHFYMPKTGVVRGELLSRAVVKQFYPDSMVFNAIPYFNDRIGHVSTFLIHTQLTDPEITKNHVFISGHQVQFDHDLVATNIEIPIDDRFTPKATDLPGDHERNMRSLEITLLQLLLDNNLYNPKWGPEAEGHIFHFEDPTMPMLKLTTPFFRNYMEKRRGL
jgi:hypothetical protein